MSDGGSVLDWLQGWYSGQCDGDWEHEWGIRIETLDNPGWLVTVDLEGTPLDELEYPEQSVERGPDDWVHTRVADRRFCGACGPGNLTEVLTAFRKWTEALPGSARAVV
ncbi:immunity 53 family protein [Streptomyces sp. NPDC054887]